MVCSPTEEPWWDRGGGQEERDGRGKGWSDGQLHRSRMKKKSPVVFRVETSCGGAQKNAKCEEPM